MAKPLNFLDEAVIEAHEAWLRYHECNEKAGHRFQQAFEKAVEKVRENPDRWPEYLLGTKYVALKRFPYLLVYRELEHELQIIAVAHGHRRQDYWKGRLS